MSGEQIAKPPEAENCGTCRFAYQHDEHHVFCRRFPPITNSGGAGGVSGFPHVGLTDVCGEYQLSAGMSL
jgi:hypothetical protein